MKNGKNIAKTAILAVLLVVLLTPSINPFLGEGAKNAMAAAGIQVIGGVQGEADLAVASYLEGKLAFDPDFKCDHHDHHHGEDHECGDHGCGDHDCKH